jgi:hypothetical protein
MHVFWAKGHTAENIHKEMLRTFLPELPNIYLSIIIKSVSELYGQRLYTSDFVNIGSVIQKLMGGKEFIAQMAQTSQSHSSEK